MKTLTTGKLESYCLPDISWPFSTAHESLDYSAESYVRVTSVIEASKEERRSSVCMNGI